jgi:hypothetical protein
VWFYAGPPTRTRFARDLLPDPAEQRQSALMRRMPAVGEVLMAIRDAVHARGLRISHERVRGILMRGAEEDAV